MPGVGLMASVVGLGSKGPEFKSFLNVELIPGGVDSVCHPSEVGKNVDQLSGIVWRSGDLGKNPTYQCYVSKDDGGFEYIFTFYFLWKPIDTFLVAAGICSIVCCNYSLLRL